MDHTVSVFDDRVAACEAEQVFYAGQYISKVLVIFLL